MQIKNHILILFIKITKTQKNFDAIVNNIIENLNTNLIYKLTNKYLRKKIIYCNCRFFVNFAIIFTNILRVNDTNNK